jgi:hypothetical protein
MKGRNLPIYRFKGDIIRKLRLSPDQNLRITFSDQDGKGFEIDDPQQIPTIEVLQKRFPESESITVTAYFNGIEVKEEEIPLIDEEPEPEPKRDTPSPLDSQLGSFVQQIIRQQEILSELKFKNFVEITNLKIDGMKSQFEEMLKSKESIYLEKLELEKEKARLELGIESEGLLYQTLSNTIEQITPHLGDLVMLAIDKMGGIKPSMVINKEPKL